MVEIITVPFNKDLELFKSEDLQKFLLNKKVNAIHPQFFQEGLTSYWTVFIDYDPVLEASEKKITPELSEADTVLLMRLREWRKVRADKQGHPVYILATNAQLYAIVERKPQTYEALKSIQGFGPKKTENYGADILKIVKEFVPSEHE